MSVASDIFNHRTWFNAKFALYISTRTQGAAQLGPQAPGQDGVGQFFRACLAFDRGHWCGWSLSSTSGVV